MTVHVGLIGGGNISGTHARAATAIPDVKIAAVYGANHEKVARLCKEFGGHPYHDFLSFLAHRPIQMVIIATPSGLHAEQGMAPAPPRLPGLGDKPHPPPPPPTSPPPTQS